MDNMVVGHWYILFPEIKEQIPLFAKNNFIIFLAKFSE